MRRLFAFLSILFLLTSNISAQVPAKTIPQFTFYKSDKTLFTPGNLNTSTFSFFVFFDATCEHCQQAIKRLNKEFGSLKNTSLYLITLNEPMVAEAFLKTYASNLMKNTNVTLLYDVRNEFIVKFGPRKYPSIFLYSADRKLIRYDDEPKNLDKFFSDIRKSKS